MTTISKTYTKKVGADRAIAAITAANAELFALDVIKLEAIKGDGGAYHVRATIIDAALVDLALLRAETRIGEIVIEQSEQTAEPVAEQPADELADFQPPKFLANEATTAAPEPANEPTASHKAAAKRAARGKPMVLPPLSSDLPQTDEQPIPDVPKPSLIEMAISAEVVAEFAKLTPKTKEEALANGKERFGAKAVEGTDFMVVKTCRGDFVAITMEQAIAHRRVSAFMSAEKQRAEQAAKLATARPATRRPEVSRKRGDGSKPVGMQAIIAEMCMRPEGATPAQLAEATKWKGVPWRWLIGNNPKKNGIADRFGYEFEARKGEGKSVTYFLRAPAEAAEKSVSEQAA